MIDLFIIIITIRFVIVFIDMAGEKASVLVDFAVHLSFRFTAILSERLKKHCRMRSAFAKTNQPSYRFRLGKINDPGKFLKPKLNL